MVKFSPEQQVEVSKLEQWYAEQIAELKRREQQIIQDYESKKVEMLKRQVDQSIK